MIKLHWGTVVVVIVWQLDLLLHM